MEKAMGKTMEKQATREAGTGAKPKSGTCAKRGRFWAVTDAAGQMVCLAVYKKGAQEVLRRLGNAEAAAPPVKIRMRKIRTRQKGQGR